MCAGLLAFWGLSYIIRGIWNYLPQDLMHGSSLPPFKLSKSQSIPFVPVYFFTPLFSRFFFFPPPPPPPSYSGCSKCCVCVTVSVRLTLNEKCAQLLQANLVFLHYCILLYVIRCIYFLYKLYYSYIVYMYYIRGLQL